jgi:hypothetical protein
MKYRIFAFFSFFLLTGLFGSDRQIALAYLKTINELWDGDRTAACQLIDNALAYDDGLSGLWFLQALYDRDKEDFPAAEESYERAFLRDDWDGGDYDGFLDSYFSFLLNLHRWDLILERGESLPYQRKDRAEVLYASGWSSFETGDRESALSQSRRGIDLYPADWRFFALALAAGGTDWLPSLIHYWGSEAAVMEKAVRQLYKHDALPPGLREWYEKRDSSFAAYLVCERTLAEKRSDALTVLDSYLKENRPDDLFLLSRLGRFGQEGVRDILNSYILAAQRNLPYDREDDDFPEMALSEDKILSFDRNGDGIRDRLVSLDRSGMPLSWQRNSRNGAMSMDFFAWPYISRVVRTGNGRVQNFDYLYPRFSLADENLIPAKAFAVPDVPTPLEWVDFLQREDLNPPFQILLKNSRFIEESRNGQISRIYHIAKGEVMAIEEDPEGEGRLSRQVLVDRGEITAARRDLDGDGVFDLYEYYEKGVWKGYAINADGEGRSEFFEDWSLIPLKIWDYDGDSFMDGYLTGTYGENMVTIVPHRNDPRDVGDYLKWERQFESKWYR